MEEFNARITAAKESSKRLLGKTFEAGVDSFNKMFNSPTPRRFHIEEPLKRSSMLTASFTKDLTDSDFVG